MEGRQKGKKKKQKASRDQKEKMEGSGEEKATRRGDHPQGRIMPSKMRWATPCHAF